MEWRDEGVILSVRRHGETAAIAEILTRGHGRSLGLVRGGRGRAQRPVLQPGNRVEAVWRARLEEHLGNFALEPVALQAGAIMEHPFRLAGVQTIAGLAQLLPEREPHPRLYEAMLVVLDGIDDDSVWPALLARWELGLLDELGFGLDLSACAVTGRRGELAFVSPRTGRAVCREAAQPYLDRLLRLPAFLVGNGPAQAADLIDALKLTGFFLNRHLFEPRGISAPEPRNWVVRHLAEQRH